MFQKQRISPFPNSAQRGKNVDLGKSLIAVNFLDILNGIQEENVCKAVTQKCPVQPILQLKSKINQLEEV